LGDSDPTRHEKAKIPEQIHPYPEVSQMKAAEGGACPEASFEALNVAITHVKKGGTIFLVTDASPYPDSDVAGAIQRLRDKGIRLNTMLTGDCSNEEDWNRLNE